MSSAPGVKQGECRAVGEGRAESTGEIDDVLVELQQLRKDIQAAEIRCGELAEIMVDHMTLHGGTKLALSAAVVAYVHEQVEGHERMFHPERFRKCDSSPDQSSTPVVA